MHGTENTARFVVVILSICHCICVQTCCLYVYVNYIKFINCHNLWSVPSPTKYFVLDL